MCNIRGNFAIIIFSKLRDGTSGNLLYISGYQSQFYRISMKIRQCAQNISARLSQWYLKLYMTRAMLNISSHYYFLYTIFLHIQYVCSALYTASCVQKVNMLWELYHETLSYELLIFL